MKIIARALFNAFLGLIIRFRLYSLMVLLYSLVIKERMANGRLCRLSSNSDNDKLTVLALYPEHFRGDLDVLAGTGEFRVLQVPVHWQTRLIFQFYPKNVSRLAIHNPSPDESLYKSKKELRSYLTVFLSKLYKKLEVHCVISSHIEHIENLDWAEISKKIGVPYIALHRECLTIGQFTKDKVKKRIEKLNSRFNGNHMAVHNETCRQLYIDIGYVKPGQISSVGCLRMDNFVKEINKNNNHKAQRKKVLLVPFLPINYILELEVYHKYARYVHDVYKALIIFAIRHSGIDLIIKTKPKEYSSVYSFVINILGELKIKIEEIGNLYVRSDIDIQELLFEIDIVCGIKSTVLLEAAIAGKPIIFPYFKEVQNPTFEYWIPYLGIDEYSSIFDIAENEEDLESLILKRLKSPIIDKNIMDVRKACFEKYVSSLKGDTKEKYSALIKQVVHTQYLLQ